MKKQAPLLAPFPKYALDRGCYGGCEEDIKSDFESCGRALKDCVNPECCKKAMCCVVGYVVVGVFYPLALYRVFRSLP